MFGNGLNLTLVWCESKPDFFKNLSVPCEMGLVDHLVTICVILAPMGTHILTARPTSPGLWAP